MAASLDKLLGIASPAICAVAQRPQITDLSSSLREELESMLAQRNGFYAFESALHVFPLEDCDPEIGVRRWNSPELWRHEYGQLLQGHFFFAEDVFGGQFSIRDDRIWMVDPETGTASDIANSLDAWAQKLLEDHRVLTGWPIAHEWQLKHGPLPIGKRLMPGRLFVLGGEYELSNLAAVDAVEAMGFRGHIAVRLADLPDGTKVRIGFK